MVSHACNVIACIATRYDCLTLGHFPVFGKTPAGWRLAVRIWARLRTAGLRFHGCGAGGCENAAMRADLYLAVLLQMEKNCLN